MEGFYYCSLFSPPHSFLNKGWLASFPQNVVLGLRNVKQGMTVLPDQTGRRECFLMGGSRGPGLRLGVGIGERSLWNPTVTQTQRLVNWREPSVGVAALSEADFGSPAEVMIPLKFSAFSLACTPPPV